jgi:hypothetical protein
VRIVGERFFDAMAERYVRAEPSRSPDLNAYGATFPEFIQAFPPAASVPYLADVARLDWACQAAMTAPQDGALDLQALAAVPEERQPDVVFEPSRSASLLRSAFPIHRIWQLAQPGGEDGAGVRLDEGGVRLIVWRQDQELRIELLEDDELRLLSEIALGRSLGEIAETLGAGAHPLDVPALLPKLVTRGWLTGFRLR